MKSSSRKAKKNVAVAGTSTGARHVFYSSVPCNFPPLVFSTGSVDAGPGACLAVLTLQHFTSGREELRMGISARSTNASSFSLLGSEMEVAD